MERLKGRTILIGKEPSQGRLLIAVQGSGKSVAIGAPHSVPSCVSRCKPQEGIAHAKISVDQNGNLTLSNMKAENVTYVNGLEILTKRIAPSCSVALGKDRHIINMPLVLESAKKTVERERPPQSEFNIKHLERVWISFHDKSMEIKKRQKQQGIYASLPMFFTMGGGAITFIFSFLFGEQYKNAIQVISGLFVVIGLLLLAYSFIKRKTDTSLEDLEKIAEEFQDSYVCPNCGKFLGNNSYSRIKKQFFNIKDQKMHCPHMNCGAIFIEK